ncbi:MAG: ribosome small subunit-dependent GTPase A [Myxococcota bacterium]
MCFLSGQRAVIGDEVLWVEAEGTGGKLVGVEPRRTILARLDHKGRQQVVAANLRGVLIVETGAAPPLAPVLLDRYRVAAEKGGLDSIVCVNKADLGLPDDAQAALNVRQEHGTLVVKTSAATGEGVDALRQLLGDQGGAWALVGRSGVGKTSLVQKLLPDLDDDDIGETATLSEYWGMGRHTTTSSRVFQLPGGGEIVDSPGIRSFTPAGLTTQDLRLHFPAVRDVQCQFRDCLHRDGEEGCNVPRRVPEPLVRSYRSLLRELLEIAAGTRRGRTEQEKKRGG